MGAQHSTPTMPTFGSFDFDYDPSTIVPPNNQNASSSSLSSVCQELPCADQRGQFYGITIHKHPERNHMMKLSCASTLPNLEESLHSNSEHSSSSSSSSSSSDENASKQQDSSSPHPPHHHHQQHYYRTGQSLVPLPKGWHVTGRMDALGGRLRLRNAKNHMVAAVDPTPTGYVILGESPLYKGQARYQKPGLLALLWGRTSTSTTSSNTNQSHHSHPSDHHHQHRRNRDPDVPLYEWATVSHKTPWSTKYVIEQHMVVETAATSSTDNNNNNNKTHKRSNTTTTTTFQRRRFVAQEYHGSQWGVGRRMVQIVQEQSGQVVAVARQYFHGDSVTDARWDVLVGPGVCPSIMILFVSILNKSMGESRI